MDFIKNIYKSIDTEKNFLYRKNISFQGYYFYPDYFCCNESSPKLMSL